MPVIRHRDGDDIHVTIIQNPPQILLEFRLDAAVGFAGMIDRGLRPRGVGVADINDSAIRISAKIPDVSGPAHAKTDHGDIQPLIGAARGLICGLSDASAVDVGQVQPRQGDQAGG